MRIRINREPLLPVLARLAGVVERRQTLPMLGNLLVVAGEESIRITGTDLELEISAGLAAEVEQTGEVTVPARKFIDICRALPESVDIRLRVEDDRAMVVAGRSRFALSTLPATDFPTMANSTATMSMEIGQGLLKSLLEKTAFAMAHQDVRYYLNGLFLEAGTGGIVAVATDGHRLAKAEANIPLEVSETMQIILPRKSVLELARLLSSEMDAIVRIDSSEKFFRATIEDTVLVSKLVDGRYPDYETVVPPMLERVAVADRDSLKQALLRTSVLSNEKYRGVRLGFEAGQIRLQSHNLEQEEAEEELVAEYSQEPTAMGFNVGYLVDVLNVLEEDEVEIYFRDSENSAIVRNKGKELETFVVMPMKL